MQVSTAHAEGQKRRFNNNEGIETPARNPQNNHDVRKNEWVIDTVGHGAIEVLLSTLHVPASYANHLVCQLAELSGSTLHKQSHTLPPIGWAVPWDQHLLLGGGDHCFL